MADQMHSRHACKVCPRTDLSLTANGRIRSHAANGKRAGADNPHCPGGSDLPRGIETDEFGQPIRECFHCDRVGCTGCVQVTASGGPNPWRSPLPTHRHRYSEWGIEDGQTVSACIVCRDPEPEPDDLCGGCGSPVPHGHVACKECRDRTVLLDVSYVARYTKDESGHEPGCVLGNHSGSCGLTSHRTQEAIEYLNNRTPEQKQATALRMDRTASAVLGLPTHRHDYEYGDDDHGHSGSFCAVCGDPEPDNTEQTEDPWKTTPSSPQTTHRGTVPGSTLPMTESVPAAGTPSSRATASGPMAPGAMKPGSAVVAEQVDDVFESAPPVQAPKPEPKRDRYGRYLLPHPDTGKRQAWTRATTLAKSISDTFALSQWSQRMTAKGLALRPDLVALAGTLDVKADKDRLNSLVEQAKDAAGQKVSANLGTAVHTYTEMVDGGGSLEDVPAGYRTDVSAYSAALAEAGLRPVPHLIERITVVPEFGTAGTLDRVLQEADGEYVIGDVKTGRTLEYGWQEIAIQLALYAHGVNTAGVWNMEKERWLPPKSYGDDPETGPWDVPRVRTDYGIVMHLPIGERTCTLYRVDLEQGWAAAELCARVRDWRKTRNLSEPYVIAEAQSPFLEALAREVGDPGKVTVRPPTWAERFAAVSSRGEAAALYNEAASVLGARSPELADLVRIAQEKLSALVEQAG